MERIFFVSRGDVYETTTDNTDRYKISVVSGGAVDTRLTTCDETARESFVPDKCVVVRQREDGTTWEAWGATIYEASQATPVPFVPPAAHVTGTCFLKCSVEKPMGLPIALATRLLEDPTSCKSPPT